MDEWCGKVAHHAVQRDQRHALGFQFLERGQQVRRAAPPLALCRDPVSRTPRPYTAVSTMILARASSTDETATFQPSRPSPVRSPIQQSHSCPSAR